MAWIVCTSCGIEYERSRRTPVEIQAGRVRALCRGCRRPCPDPEPADYRYWTARFSTEEITAMSATLNASR